jgi:hypothetical protein
LKLSPHESVQTANAVRSASIAPSTSLRSPDEWVAYGRFIFESVSQSQSHKVETVGPGLLSFRRLVHRYDPSFVYAFQQASHPDDSVWHTAQSALDRLVARESVDHLCVFVAGHDPTPTHGSPIHFSAQGKEFVAIANTCLTNEIIEFPATFGEFLMKLGHNNRRHMRGQRKKAEREGLRFEISSERALISPGERYRLGANSRPYSFQPFQLDSWDAFAHRHPGFLNSCIRDHEGTLVSYCSAIVEGDSAIMMYQLNDKSHPELGLTMMHRGFLIENFIEQLHLSRIILPRGIEGHLKYAATTNTYTEVFFIRRSLSSYAKAIAMRIASPGSHQASIVCALGFLGALFAP